MSSPLFCIAPASPTPRHCELASVECFALNSFALLLARLSSSLLGPWLLFALPRPEKSSQRSYSEGIDSRATKQAENKLASGNQLC
jgi:hypothetical protein